MLRSPRVSFSRIALCAAACALLPACADAPTGPQSYVQEAGGDLWVAVVEPVGMPDARTWLPFVPAGSPAAERVRALQGEAGRARRAGELERGMALEAEAAREAAGAIGRAPPAQTVLEALAALESWVQRAELRTETGRFPGLDTTSVRVRERRDEARALLAQGDTGAAAVKLAAAAEAAREYAPLAVGLRLVERCEARIDRQGEPTPNLKRARRLLGTAREALAMGDEGRAVKRALYALQLLEQEEARRAGRGDSTAAHD